MRNTKWLVVLLLLLRPAWAAIATGNFACNHQDNTATKSVAVTITVNNGDSVWVGIIGGGSAPSVTSISGGGTYSQQQSYNASEIWATGVGSGASAASVTVNYSNAVRSVACVGTFTGVLAYGNAATSSATTCSTCSVAITTQDNNNYTVVFFGQQSLNTFTQSAGTLQAQDHATSTNPTMAIVTNTAVSAGSLTSTVTVTSAATQRSGNELRSVAPASSGHNSTLPLMGVGE